MNLEQIRNEFTIILLQQDGNKQVTITHFYPLAVGDPNTYSFGYLTPDENDRRSLYYKTGTAYFYTHEGRGFSIDNQMVTRYLI